MFVELFVGATNLVQSFWNQTTPKTNTAGLKNDVDNLLKKIDYYVGAGMPISRKKRNTEVKVDLTIDNGHYTRCVYWLADCKDMVVPRVVDDRNLNFSMHGAWGKETKTNQGVGDNCLTIEQFTSVFTVYCSLYRYVSKIKFYLLSQPVS